MKQKPWNRIIRPSTIAFMRQARRTRGYSFFDFLHGYVYARWTYLYLGIGIGEHPLARWWTRTVQPWIPRRGTAADPAGPSQPRNGSNGLHTGTGRSTGTHADGYHGKVLPLEGASRLVSVREPIAAPLPETVIPFEKARDLILDHPDHIVALDCPCRSAREHPCLPLDVCLIVGEPFASFVVEHHPQRSRRITQQEAVKILRQEDAHGHVHHAFFKDAMFGRFYAICNCCSCCCGAIQAQRNGTPMLISSGYTCRVNEDLCMACGECEAYCSFDALRFTTEEEMQDRLYGIVVEPEKCMGCGVCVSQCANGALSLIRDPLKGEPLENLQFL